MEKSKPIVYAVVFLPVFSGPLAMAIPDWSPSVAVIIAIILACNCVLGAVFKMIKFHNRSRVGWQLFNMAQLDLFALFCMVVSWRIWGQGILISTVLILIIFATLIFGYIYRRIILQEVVSPKTSIGKIIIVIGVVSPIVAGGLARLFNFIIDKTFGPHVLEQCFAFIFVIIPIYLIIVMQSSLYKLENPNFE